MGSSHVRLKFWGVRGSTPTPQIENLNFGGNTSCVEIRTESGETIILDGGSGIRNLGTAMMQEAAGKPISVDIFLTHFHWDHIQGLPFFPALYGSQHRMMFHSGNNCRPLQETLEGQMTQPYFPVQFTQVAASRDFNQFALGECIKTAGLTVRPFPMNHPQGACGYRVESDNAVIVYATDYEHGVPELDKELRRFAEGADILICDAQYTPQEYETHKGWGHSTWINAVSVARDAKAKQLILFHHDPSHNDQTMMRIAEDARMQFENTTAAWEGFVAVL
jgi:phosphoribosyl 1,2-cyclic phosphodiesterase